MDRMSEFFSALSNIPDDRYDGDNHSFALNQPVFACDRSWTVVEQVQVKLALDSGAATRECFPFDCTLT